MKPTWRRRAAARRSLQAEVHTLVGSYVLDAVTDSERDAVEGHLALCRACRTEVAQLRATVAKLGAAAETPPPPGLRARVLAAARTSQQSSRLPGTDCATLTPGWRRRTIAVAAAAVLVVGTAGVTQGLQRGSLDAARRQVAAAQANHDQMAGVLAAPDARVLSTILPGGGRARMVLSPTRGQAVVALSGLPRLDADRTYQLWLVAGGLPRSAGALDVGQHHTTRLLDSIRDDDTFAISIEPAGGSLHPSSVWASMPLRS